MLLALREYNNLYDNNYNHIDYSGYTLEEAFYEAMIDDYTNWSTLENAILVEKADRITIKSYQIIDNIEVFLKKCAEKVMGILLTWKQRINVFIGKISLKFVSKNKSDSIVLKSKNWKKIYNEVNSYNYIKYTDVNDILLFGGSIDLNDIDKKVKEWTGDKELSSANIIANASKKYNNEEDIKFTFTDVENGIKSAKTNINKIYNENLSIKRYIDDEIKTLNLLKENSKKDIADGYKPTIKLLKSINHNNFILLQAKLNSYNEYIKLLGKAARSFKAKSDKNTEVSKDSYVDVDELPPEDKTFSTSYDDEI